MSSLHSKISRRFFIKASGITGAALSLGIFIPANGTEPQIINKDSAEKLGVELNSWISIDTSGKVTIINHRAEMGQGSFQSVPQMIAEELEVDLNSIDIVFAKGSQTKYGSQITGGSSTIRGSYKRLLKLGATARQMLVNAAAEKWKVPAGECQAINGEVIHKSSGRQFHYGELVEAASKLEAPADVPLKHPREYKVIRQPLPRQDTPSKVNGKAVFGIDKRLPGMLYAVVERNPRFLGKVKSFDDSDAKAVPGVKHVLKVKMNVFSHQREGVAVVADNLWSAMQGRKALKVTWDDTGSNTTIHKSYMRLCAKA